jgi:hypothetical protein
MARAPDDPSQPTGPMKMLARLALVAALVASCGGDSEPADAPADAGACEGPASGGCEVVVATAEQCPTFDEVCAGVCGASYDCCYCAPPDWQTIALDCPPCTDAGGDLSSSAGPSSPGP